MRRGMPLRKDLPRTSRNRPGEEVPNDLFKRRLIHFIKGRLGVTIEVKHAQHCSRLIRHGHDQFREVARITSDVASSKVAHVTDKEWSAGKRSLPARAVQADGGARRFVATRTECHFAFVQVIETHPR